MIERLFNFSRIQIQDRDSFDLAFNDLLVVTESELSGSQRSLRNRVFKAYVKENKDVSTKRLFKEAKGRSLSKDRKTTAKEVVTTIQEFKKKGARQVDLKGFDTIRQKFDKKVAEEREFDIPARVRGKVVFARRETVTVRGKKQARLRNAKGQFSKA